MQVKMGSMIRNIKITPVLNGFLVTVGCQTVVFEGRAKLIQELHAYLDNPDEMEKKYRESSINRCLLEEACVAQTPGRVSQEAPGQGCLERNPATR